MTIIELTKDNTRHPCSVCTSASECESPHALGHRNHLLHNYDKEKPLCFVKTLVFGHAKKKDEIEKFVIKPHEN